MRKVGSIVPLAAACGALLCVSLTSSGRLASKVGPAAPVLGHEPPEAPGVAVAPAERAGSARTLRMPGRVALEEGRVYRVNAGMRGSVRDALPVVTGSRVRKDQVLGSFYAPDAATELSLFMINHLGYDPETSHRNTPPEADASRASGSLYKANISRRTAELENMGVSARQRAVIAQEGRIPDTIEIVAPADGVVLERNLSPGLKFDRGFELFRIADLSRLWVVADVFPQDARDVRPGLAAEISVPELDVRLPATIERVLPEADPVTRTTRVRLAVENRGGALLPGMFAEVRVRVERPPAVVVPADAVVDSGRSETVFVRSPGGALEPRPVRTGARTGDRLEVVEGLAAGERVATAGAFLLDSETPLRAGAGTAAAQPERRGSPREPTAVPDGTLPGDVATRVSRTWPPPDARSGPEAP